MKKGVSFVREHRDHKIMVCPTKPEYERHGAITNKTGLASTSDCQQEEQSAIRTVGKHE